MLRDDCADRDCGHAPESHYLETRPTGRLDGPSFEQIRVACTMAKCDCPHYVPPEHLRRRS